MVTTTVVQIVRLRKSTLSPDKDLQYLLSTAGYYDQLVHFNKEIYANVSPPDVYRHSLWEYSKRFHCSFEWHLTPHVTLSIETCIRRTPCIKRTIQHSPRVSCNLNIDSNSNLKKSDELNKLSNKTK